MAQDKPAASATPPVLNIDTPDAPGYKDAGKLGRQLGEWLEQYAKTKKPSADLKKKIADAVGKSVMVSGFLVSGGDPIDLRVGAADYQGGVEYIFHFDKRNERLGGAAACLGTVSHIDPVKKIVILDTVSLRWLGSD